MTIIDKVVVHCVDDIHGGTVGRQIRAITEFGGPAGPKGDTGDSGPAGAQGVKGDTGDTGPQGERGIQGEQGIQGVKGDTGDTGPQGPEGPEGPQGPQGEPGESGSGGGGMVSVRVTQDVANTTTSMANATGLSFAAEANSDYIIDANILWNTSATSVGIKLSADFSSTGHVIAGQWVVNAANGTLDGAAFNADDVTVTTAASPFTTSNHAKLWAILRTGANAGTFMVRFAAETTGTITIRTGSVLRYEKTL